MSTEVEATVAGGNVPTESSMEDAKPDVEEPDINLEMLPLIKEAQSQHGLRHGDYQRYRMYCSRRLGRMRKALHFTQGHRNRYQKKTITVDTITDARFLCIQLVCAERAWAMSMELKQAANTEPRKRFHLLRRLKRASKHASDLSKLCEECARCDVRTRLEAQAYCSWMQGNLMFEQQQWQAALDAFGQSQAIYERLAGAVPEEQRGVYLQRVDDISPNIRYCAYNIGDMPTDMNQLMAMRNVSDMLASKINLVLNKTQEKAATSLTEVGWLGKKVPVKSERLRVSLVKLQLVEGELGRAGEVGKKMEVYETILMECQDTMQIVREEITSETALFEKKKTAKGETQLGHLRSIMSYLMHIKLTHVIHRNLLLLGTMQAKSGSGLESVAPGKQPTGKVSKPEEFVRVYDILLQHVSDLADIPGLDDLTSQKENTARTFAFKAFRCYHLAESYASVKKWAEAMGLMDRALEHVTQTLEQYRELQLGAEEMHKIDKSLIPELTKLQATIRGRKCEVHVESILESEPLDEAMNHLKLSSKPLTERLDEFVLSPSGVKPLLATLPPNYKPVPHKPLFFDLALNHVEYPSLDHRVEKKGGGITGFVKGLIWGSKS